MSQASQLKAMDDYFQSLLNDSSTEASDNAVPEMKSEIPTAGQNLSQQETKSQKTIQYSEAVPAPKIQKQPAEYGEQLPVTLEKAQQLNQLLSSLELNIAEEVETTLQQEIAVSNEIETEIVIDSALETVSAPTWSNIEVSNEFPALFFIISGVTFAVPLTELGGIHKLEKVTPLFGKPDWFSGVMTMREEKLNAVDGARWFMPGKEIDDPYQYLILLGESKWGIECHQLIGTETLHVDQIKWRDKPGKRPWLAGMVKDKMCALLHVQELLTLLKRGVNIDGQ